MSNTRYFISKNNCNPNYELLYISKSKFENDWHSTAHFHPFTEIFFITDGKGAFYLNDQIVTVNKWDLIIINSIVYILKNLPYQMFHLNILF